MNGCRPNLFIIGAMKAGTTRLHTWLGQHPEIFMSRPKEPCYFVERSQLASYWPQAEQRGVWRSEQHYLDLFKTAGAARIVGESSTLYTKAPLLSGVPDRIAAYNPDARLIYLMRDPVERTISHYWHRVRKRGECRTMLGAIKESPIYQDVSHYAMQLEPYLARFPDDQVITFSFEEMTQDPARVLRQIFEWLSVDSNWLPTDLDGRENATPPVVEKVRGRGILHRFRDSPLWNAVGPYVPRAIRRIGVAASLRAVNRLAEPLEPVYRFLRPLQQEQTEGLKRLLGREFPEWTMLYDKAEVPPRIGDASEISRQAVRSA